MNDEELGEACFLFTPPHQLTARQRLHLRRSRRMLCFSLVIQFIFMAGGRADSHGGFDLYLSYNRNGAWTKSTNLSVLLRSPPLALSLTRHARRARKEPLSV
jgi:hypothetical protein